MLDHAVGILGALLLLIGVVWRYSVSRSGIPALRSALSHHSPGRRAEAIDGLSPPLSGYVPELLDSAHRETTSEVLDALVRLLERLPAEADSGEVAELRQAVIAREAALYSFADSHLTGGAVKPQTVLVTGAGGAAGVSVIRCLRRKGHRVVGADSDPRAVGLRLAHTGTVLPPFTQSDYVDRLVESAIVSRANCLISTLAEEMISLSGAAHRLTEAGIAHWLPPVDAIAACIDKWRFAELVRHSGDPAPATGLGSADGVPPPWIVKPRFGRGSRDVLTVDDPDELEWALRRVAEPLVQTRLTGREFTVDALIDRSGRLVGGVPRWRLETKAGISTKGETFASRQLLAQVGRLAASLGYSGPANFQGFMTEQEEFSFVEVNPRFSGGLPLSLAAGADLVGEYLRGSLGEPVLAERLEFAPGVTMLRHYEEVFEGLEALGPSVQRCVGSSVP